jgi:hypothetical protein
MKQKLADAEETITALKEQLYGLPGKIRELESENAALKAVLRCRNDDYDDEDSDEDNEYERPDGMSDKEFRAYVAFRNQRKDVYPDYYTEMTIAPVEESEWQQRLQEMREDGLIMDMDDPYKLKTPEMCIEEVRGKIMDDPYKLKTPEMCIEEVRSK